jgi:sporulation integral membrane protein YtvI
MIIDVAYWTRVLKNILYIILLLLGLYIELKLSIFYMPFLIAFIISLIIEPAIKFIMRKTKLTRRSSSIIIFILVSVIILGSLSWMLITLFSESSSLLQGLNDYFDKAYIQFQAFMNNFQFDKIRLSDEILNVIQNSTGSILENVSIWLRNSLTGLIDLVTSLPSIAICIGITVIALYFICVDKIYILDQIEHHLPKLWVKKITNHLRDLIKTLGGYLKAEATLILVSFIISLIGLYILQFVGFNVQYPLLMALFIGFVDALPILGSGSVMIPWAIICAINGDIKLGIAIIILLIIMSVTRQLLEPKLVSKNIGVHPIFTLIAMYTGFKIIGIIGLLIGPIILIIFKNIFSSLIDQGVFKTIFDKK